MFICQYVLLGDGFFYNEDEVQLGAEQTRVLNHLESVFVVPDEFSHVSNGMQDGTEEDNNLKKSRNM